MATVRVLLALLAAAPLSAPSAQAQGSSTEALRRRVDALLAGREHQLIELRRDIHQHPELSGAEQRTAALVAARLRELGLEVKTGVGGNGVVGVLRGAKPGPLIAYRADMDAFPSTAPDPVDFRSTTPGVRHICGHDIHTTIGLALAEGLASVRNELAGTVMFIFQPAEERATGAKAMLADGVFGTAKPVAIYAVHTAPLPVGQLGTIAGGLMPGRDLIHVTLTGSGNLQAAADSARRIIEAVGNITPAQAVAPAPEGFVFAQVGPARSTTAGTWTVDGSLTIASATTRTRAREAVLAALSKLASAGVTIKPVYEVKTIAGVTNDSALVEQANASIGAAIGAGAVIPITTIYPGFSEDFGSFQDQVPGVFYFLGVANAAKGWTGMPHSPDYVADEGSILVAARAMTAVILDRLAGVRRPTS
ncbi:MAG: amidohydrolase [Gemmatimonadota bacterium]